MRVFDFHITQPYKFRGEFKFATFYDGAFLWGGDTSRAYLNVLLSKSYIDKDPISVRNKTDRIMFAVDTELLDKALFIFFSNGSPVAACDAYSVKNSSEIFTPSAILKGFICLKYDIAMSNMSDSDKNLINTIQSLVKENLNKIKNSKELTKKEINTFIEKYIIKISYLIDTMAVAAANSGDRAGISYLVDLIANSRSTSLGIYDEKTLRRNPEVLNKAKKFFEKARVHNEFWKKHLFKEVL